MKKKILASLIAVVLVMGLVAAFAVNDEGGIGSIQVKEEYDQLDPSTEPTWYTNNTVSVLGISLRDDYPSLTNKWYNVLPVDLSKDGVQTYRLVASNLYYMGNVIIYVNGDSVTTTYTYPKQADFNVYPVEECLAWFTGMEEITSSFLENPTSDMTFGTAISKEKDLNGQQTALLFICNRITYRVPFNDEGVAPIRLWRNNYRLNDYFAGVKENLEKVEAEYAQKKEEAEAAAKAAEEAAAAKAAEEEAAAEAAETNTEAAEATEAPTEEKEAAEETAEDAEGTEAPTEETEAAEETAEDAEGTEAPAEETEAAEEAAEDAEATEAPAAE